MKNIHKIQWLNLPGYTGETWNPIIGCSKISDGCKNCYAEKMASRISGMELANIFKRKKLSELPTQYNRVMNGNKWNGNTWFVDAQINKPAKWKKPRVIFVCSMGDLFHESIRFHDIDVVFDQMMLHPQHIYIVLTKRAERMAEYFGGKRVIAFVPAEKRAHIYLGVTAENQEQANARLPHLIKIPAAVKFVSVEPMLSAVDVSLWMCSGYFEPPFDDIVNWVICGGESGHHARPVHPDWVRSLRNQCQAASVPFFFKQWGEWAPGSEYGPIAIRLSTDKKHMLFPDFTGMYKAGKHKSGNTLDGVKYEEYPNERN